MQYCQFWLFSGVVKLSFCHLCFKSNILLDKIGQMTYYMTIFLQNYYATLCIMSARISGKEKSVAFIFAHISYRDLEEGLTADLNMYKCVSLILGLKWYPNLTPT